MDINLTSEPATNIEADAVVIGWYQKEPLTKTAAMLDDATGGVLTRLVETEEITGKHGDLTTLLAPAGVKAGQILIVGLGERSDFDRGAACRAVATAAKQLAEKKRQTVAFYVEEDWAPEIVESGVCGALVGCQGQDLYRTEKKLSPFPQVLWSGKQQASVDSGRILAESINLTRRLVNQPASEIYPESFAAEAEQVANHSSLTIEVWDEPRLEAERCGSLLAVGRGSTRRPRLVILQYQGAGNGQAPLALVGKGVTFDSG
ncbi:MAG: M17 family peptidase N-terminal domain-containing protein, partial [Pirellulaceae bacterium]